MNRNMYRGKHNDEWVYGYLIGNDVIVGEIVEFNDEYFNCEFWYKVDPLSVEEFKCVECKKTLSEKKRISQ